MDWGDAAGWISSGAATVAVVFGGVELGRSRRLDAENRQAELDGVAVSWQATEVPRHADADGLAQWKYAFVAHNTCRLPISDVRIKVEFALGVRRVHYDGDLGHPTRNLELYTPVIAGGDRRPWNRKLRMDLQQGRELLKQTRATISFDPVSGARRRNHWPSPGNEAGPMAGS